MTTLLSLFFAAVAGFGHAFEADHLVAVSSIVTRRNSTWLAVKDGIFWGMGHTSTILLVGLLILVGKVALSDTVFHYLEACVGLMLLTLGGFRLFTWMQNRLEKSHFHAGHHHPHIHEIDMRDQHGLAYSIGLVHGLAGSGAMVLLVMTNIRETWSNLLYLLLFGIGSIGGMLVAAGLFSLPFSKRITSNRGLQKGLTLLSALLCIGLGLKIMIENLWMTN